MQRGDIDVIAPGFAADYMETLEEIAIRYACLYRSHGGGELRCIERLARPYQGAGEPAAPSSSGLGARSAYLLKANAG